MNKAQTRKHREKQRACTYAYKTHHIHAPYIHARAPGTVQWMYHTGFNTFQICICLKGICRRFFPLLFSRLFSDPSQCKFIFFLHYFLTFFLIHYLFLITRWRASVSRKRRPSQRPYLNALVVSVWPFDFGRMSFVKKAKL